MRRSQKAQFEIMGLAVLVVIVIIGAVFFIGRTPQNTATSANDYEYDLLAQSTIDTFLRTDAGDTCPGMTMYDLVRDAAMGDPNQPPCGKSSVDILNETAESAVSNVTGTKYNFVVQIQGNPDTIINRIGCFGRGIALSRRGEQSIILQPTTQTAVVSLQFCPGAR